MDVYRNVKRSPKNIAIIGAGFAGMAAAWHLLKLSKGSINITVIDPHGVGNGASGVAAGLMHPFAGGRSKYNPEGREGYQATLKLLDAATQELGQHVYEKSGVLRSALNQEQLYDFKKCVIHFPEDAIWLDAEECQRYVPGIVRAPGIFFSEAITVHSCLYLEGLWRSCQRQGVKLINRPINSLKSLKGDYDILIVAMGASTINLPELSHLPIGRLKGQILEFDWPEHIEPLKTAINSQIYMVMSPDRKRCIVGSTFEREYCSEEVDLETAKASILPKLMELFPAFKGQQPINCRAGIRATAPMHMPLMEQVEEGCWVLTGFGSKGLLYHALYAKRLAEMIFTEKAEF